MVHVVKCLVWSLALTTVACAHPQAAPVQPVMLEQVDGTRTAFAQLAARAPWTVLVFVSAECPCVTAHLPRLRALAEEYRARGVQFVAVDSEVGSSPETAARQTRDYALPVLRDVGARLAEQLSAEYAGYSVVVDSKGVVRYRGGLDSDKETLHAEATPHLRNALEDVLAGRSVRTPEAKALGCVLRKW